MCSRGEESRELRGYEASARPAVDEGEFCWLREGGGNFCWVILNELVRWSLLRVAELTYLDRF